MALIDSVKNTTLGPKSTKVFDGQVSKLAKDYAKISDLEPTKIKKYTDNLPK